MANKNEIGENEEIKEIELENKLSKSKLKGEESENREIARNNKREVELLEIRNQEVELGKVRRIEIDVRERQHANKSGTVPKATIRSIETISGPRDKYGPSKSMLHEHTKGTDILNSTHKGMLSPNMENTVGYWRILYEENVDLDRIKLRKTELNYLMRERKVREMEMEKLEKDRLETERIIEEKLERDKLERDIYKRTQWKGDRTFEVDSFIETNNEFWKGAEILIENEEQKNDKSKIQELTLEIVIKSENGTNLKKYTK